MVKPLATATYGEHKEDFVATLMDYLNSGKGFNPGQVATVTALENIFKQGQKSLQQHQTKNPGTITTIMQFLHVWGST